MKERPILFSGRMVRAILAGRKTQTRRVIKGATGAFWDHAGYRCELDYFGITVWSGLMDGIVNPHGPKVWCPYGDLGDRLYVRESWRAGQECDEEKPSELPVGTEVRYEADGIAVFHRPVFTAGESPSYSARMEVSDGWGKLRPGIFLPRWASRITLEITSVKVERLQAISEADILAEGVERPASNEGFPDRFALQNVWAQGWNKINGKRPGCSWAANPWLWCITFKNLSCQNPNQG